MFPEETPTRKINVWLVLVPEIMYVLLWYPRRWSLLAPTAPVWTYLSHLRQYILSSKPEHIYYGIDRAPTLPTVKRHACLARLGPVNCLLRTRQAEVLGATSDALVGKPTNGERV